MTESQNIINEKPKNGDQLWFFNPNLKLSRKQYGQNKSQIYLNNENLAYKSKKYRDTQKTDLQIRESNGAQIYPIKENLQHKLIMDDQSINDVNLKINKMIKERKQFNKDFRHLKQFGQVNI
ncbi:hypothetical protein PPERSA_07953 [Pseudocohnilembus persalinus]|uniref:Uncharacterized protein n=1 Tax=Pseudocohnilembus persalinus TaxID=266149 RepID=A0A0V0QB49_PSEPJ|nr:hypothetical protein PPERSA_07953 [Pseudocohnilembus persalinus]|eukprot:KRW99468.1 hypothetical protein PPERSA_07953 [Pseudocohnilembus persalinus]